MSHHIDFVAGSAPARCDEEEIDELSLMMRSDIPEFEFDQAYLTFIRTHFGGRPTQNKYAGANGTVWIDRFLNFLAPATNDFSNINVVWSAIEDRLSPGMFPVAENGLGDYICMDHSNGGIPSVVLWFHETSEEGRPHVEEIASTFEEFINGLKGTA